MIEKSVGESGASSGAEDVHGTNWPSLGTESKGKNCPCHGCISCRGHQYPWAHLLCYVCYVFVQVTVVTAGTGPNPYC